MVKMARGWRRLQNEELHNLYVSLNIVKVITLRRMKLAGHIACSGDNRSAHKILISKPEGNRPLRRPMHRQDIRMNFRETGW